MVLHESLRRSRRPRRRHTGQAAQGLVEFTLVAPLVFLLLIGAVVTGVAVTNQTLLSNGVRDSARAAATCGGSYRDPATQLPSTGTVPAHTCSWANLDTYVAARLSQLAGGHGLSAPSGGSNCATLPSGDALVCIYNSSNSSSVTVSTNPMDACQIGYKIEVSAQYAQPLFLPLVGNWLGNNGSTTTRTLTADAEATCEQ
jgi:TadE-like protein